MPRNELSPQRPARAVPRRQWSASARRRQRRSCSLRCACSTLTPPTHRQPAPGSRNNPSLTPGTCGYQRLSSTPPPTATGPRDEEAAARGATCDKPMSSNGIQPRSNARVPRPAEALLPNSPSCGNQPANISLTAPSRTDTHAHSSTWSGHRSGAWAASPGAASPCPL